ncbi:MAG: hypothetical protein R3B93_15535 [Bacteroidia bacterium]
MTTFRQQQFKIVTDQLIADGIMKSPSFPSQMEISVLSDFRRFWISSAEIFYDGPEEGKVQHYVDLLFQGIVPYLTDEGMGRISGYEERKMSFQSITK